MPRLKSSKATKSKAPRANVFQLRKTEQETPEVHVLKRGVVCATDGRGHATPKGRSPLRIVLEAWMNGKFGSPSRVDHGPDRLRTQMERERYYQSLSMVEL
jgi:hypothetical protein